MNSSLMILISTYLDSVLCKLILNASFEKLAFFWRERVSFSNNWYDVDFVV